VETSFDGRDDRGMVATGKTKKGNLAAEKMGESYDGCGRGNGTREKSMAILLRGNNIGSLPSES
jgi:hypothetical protein